MPSIDLYRAWPSIRRRSTSPAPAAKGRSTTLDRTPCTEAARKADTGPDNPARFLQILVESISGKPLSSFFPVAQGIPKIIGADGLANATDFQSFLEGFHQAMQFFILPNQPAVRQDDGTRRRLVAGAMGVRRTENVRPATPRPVRRFDDFMAMLPPDPATLEAALQAGTSDGLPIGFSEALSALIGGTRAAIFANDSAALLNLGQDFGSLLAALNGVVNGGGEDTERAVRVRKFDPLGNTSRAVVTGVDFDVDAYTVDSRGHPVRKRPKLKKV